MLHRNYHSDIEKHNDLVVLADCVMDQNSLILRHYFPNDDILQEPVVKWRSHANLLFENWLNCCVYQTIMPSLVSS